MGGAGIQTCQTMFDARAGDGGGTFSTDPTSDWEEMRKVGELP